MTPSHSALPVDVASTCEVPANSTNPAIVDGRVLRRLRNREAVIDGFLDLIGNGAVLPSFEQIAQHSGVSFRSVYRYFDSNDELVAAAAQRGRDRALAMLDFDQIGVGSLDERVDNFIRFRLDVHEATVGLTVAAIARFVNDPNVSSVIDEIRRLFVSLLERHFAVELDGLSTAERKAAVMAMYAGMTFESVRFLCDQFDHDRAAVAAVLRRQINAHLAPVPAAS